MQGRKHFTPQLFYELSLDMLVPEDNYYRKLLTELDLHFIYKSPALRSYKLRSVIIKMFNVISNFSNFLKP